MTIVVHPKGVHLETHGSQVLIKYRWFHPKFLFVTPFACIWTGVAATMFWHVLNGTNAPWFMPYMLALFLIFGVAFVYTSFAKLVNHTEIHVGQGQLTVKHGPLPWRGNIKASALEFQQFYCKEKRHQNKNGVSFDYAVMGVRKDSTELTIADSIDDQSRAIFIEHHIEDALGIGDIRVKGEVAAIGTKV